MPLGAVTICRLDMQKMRPIKMTVNHPNEMIFKKENAILLNGGCSKKLSKIGFVLLYGTNIEMPMPLVTGGRPLLPATYYVVVRCPDVGRRQASSDQF